MPVIFRHNGVRYQFYANEGDPREPIHVHAVKDGTDAKFWVLPEVRMAYNDGHSAQVLRQMLEQVRLNKTLIERVWNGFFGSTDEA